MRFHRIDGKFRADNLTIMTVYTVIHLYDSRGVIPLLIELVRKFQHLFGAVFDAVTAPLTSVLNDVHYAAGGLNPFNI